jgi:hypothetical protein
MPDRTDRIFAPLALIALLILAWFPAGLSGSIAAYAVLMFLPGLGLYLLVERRPSALEGSVSALALSPVITCGLAIIFMVFGMSADSAVRWNLAAAGILGLAGVIKFNAAPDRTIRRELTSRQWAVLGFVVVATLVLVGYQPATSEWWRVRSDAWFHAAVVAQVSDFGLPPDDPYFAGFALQYMWFYHVLVLVLSKAAALDPFRVMTFLNLQSLCGLLLATILFSGVFVRSFAKRVASCVTVAFGMNGLFWLFLPIKIVRVFVGQVRGTEELARTFSLSPFEMQTAMKFLWIYHNQDLLLDKFMVATAFSTALCCMAVFWFAVAEFLRSRRWFPLIATAIALTGMVGFHTLFGMINSITIFGGLVLLFLFRRWVSDYRLRPALELAAACAVAIAVIAPYLYAITHEKQAGHAFQLAVTLPGFGGIVISCAAAAFLAIFQRRFFRSREMPHRYVQYALLTTTIFCALMVLPQGGAADKIATFVFYPLAVIGGWSIVDLIDRQKTRARKAAVATAIAVLIFIPVNAIWLAAYYNTPTTATYTSDEVSVAAWVRENTPREAVFIDRDEEVFLLVAGPRRYYCGRWAYAYQWAYDKLEMSGRMHVRDALYRDDELDVTALRILGEAPWELYVIDRGDWKSGLTRLDLDPSLFQRVFSAGRIAVYRVDTAACAAAADKLRRAGVPEVPAEELIRESGL